MLLELRESAAQKNWAAVSAALGSPALRRDMTRISRIVKQETDFLARARDFHLLDRQLQDFVSSFDPAPPVRNMSFQYLQGAEIDYSEGVEGAQFVIKNPNATSTCGCGSSFSA